MKGAQKDSLDIVFASTNPGKFGEVREVASRYGINLVSPQDLCGAGFGQYGLTAPLAAPPDVVEGAGTYMGNARLKADGFYEWCGLPSLADDTGLEVDALDGSPGVYSARYAGPGCTPAMNIQKLLAEMAGRENRAARFYCALFLRMDPQNSLTAEAILEGSIRREQVGRGGFGYDSVFEVCDHARTLAELKGAGAEVKTHRILACEKLFACLQDG